MCGNGHDDWHYLADRIGRHMAALRRGANVSQATVADRLGVTQATVSKWELGRLPTLRELLRYADAIGVSAGDLLAPIVGTVEPLDTRQRALVRELIGTLEVGDA